MVAWHSGGRNLLGAVALRRDGGKGGDIVMESSQRHNTLVHFLSIPSTRRSVDVTAKDRTKRGETGTESF